MFYCIRKEYMNQINKKIKDAFDKFEWNTLSKFVDKINDKTGHIMTDAMITYEQYNYIYRDINANNKKFIKHSYNKVLFYINPIYRIVTRNKIITKILETIDDKI